jgi:hypothetical protein
MTDDAANGSCLLLLICPQCKETRSVQMNRALLKQELEGEMDVKVLSAVCGHTWSLTAQEKESVRKALTDSRI